jgi:hypothetical protein
LLPRINKAGSTRCCSTIIGGSLTSANLSSNQVATNRALKSLEFSIQLLRFSVPAAYYLRTNSEIDDVTDDDLAYEFRNLISGVIPDRRYRATVAASTALNLPRGVCASACANWWKVVPWRGSDWSCANTRRRSACSSCEDSIICVPFCCCVAVVA